MKTKLLSLLIAAVMTPCAALAISLAEIERDPGRYVLVEESAEAAFYIDTDSIRPVRHEPPRRALQAVEYIVFYGIGSIEECHATFRYDHRRSMTALEKEWQERHPGLEVDEKAIKMLCDAMS